MRSTTNNIESIFCAILFSGIGSSVLADNPDSGQSMTPEKIEAWFNDDAEERAMAVNEGNLEFLSSQPDMPVHHSHNTLIIDNNSLVSGRVELIQCHSQLDTVPSAQIVYRYRQMRNLRVVSFSKIKRAWVEDDTVQLENIQSGSRLCIKADVGILYSLAEGGFILKNGPFHRKFLDGYYPMRVTLDVRFPSESIRFESIIPTEQPGFSVRQGESEIHVNAWFEGKLMTEIRFMPITFPPAKIE